MRFRALLLKVVGLFLLLGGVSFQASCSGSRASGGTYRAELGRGPSPRLIADVAAGVLQSYGYQLRNVSENRVETEWRARDIDAVRAGPAGDPSGFSLREAQVRDRARIQINRRGDRFYVAQLTVVHQRSTEDGGWEREEPSEAALAQYQTIERRIRDYLQEYMTQR